MPKGSKANLKVKQENEIQSYINSFKEIEETEALPSTSDDKVFITTDENYEQIEATGDNDEEYKYVFIVQDEDEDGGDDKIIGEDDGDGENQVYEFDEFEAEMLDDEEEKIIPKTSVKKEPVHSSGVTHNCNYCNYSTSKRYLLARHMKCHSEDRPHKCNVCERGFKTIASLTNHVNTHTGVKVGREVYSIFQNSSLKNVIFTASSMQVL